MARKRMIHPAYFTSQTLNALPVTTMMTFAGIWCWADDYGRGEWAPELIKAAVWPRRKSMTEAKVEAAMHQLVQAGVLCYYEVADHPLLHVVSWKEFQQVSHPARPIVPPCHFHEAEAFEIFLGDTDSAREKFRRTSGGLPEEALTCENARSAEQSSGGRPETFRRSVVEVSSDQSSSASSVVTSVTRKREGGDGR